MRISEREKLVLNAIVDYYLTVGDTIGSRTLVKKYGIELSSATIRNVMADLEDMGFIEKTHTSSGRIPTDMGYKYYLTELLKVEKITQEEIENISNVYNRRVDELENILKQTSTLLSKLTNYAGIAVEPKPDNTKVDRVELVYIDEYLIMAVIVMEDRRVKTKNIHLPYPISKDEVDKKVVELNDKIKNNEIAINDIEKFFTESSDIIYEHDDEDELSKYFINNLPGVLKDRDIEEVTDVIEFFNERKDIRDLFEKLIEQKAKENSKTNVNVILGDELGIKELEDFSFVYSIYNLGGAQGIIGVMGPKRMAYSKTMGEETHEHEHEHKHGGHTCCGKHGHKHEEETKKLKAEIETLKNDYLRKQAEFQNFTKRKMNEVEELKKFASEKIITQLLGSLDNFERAIEASNESKDFDSLLQGVEMIVRNLKDIMTGEGVEEISTEGAFNPEYHHAVGVEACEDKKEDEIVKVLQKGYTMKGKVIRPAMVIVCKK